MRCDSELHDDGNLISSIFEHAGGVTALPDYCNFRHSRYRIAATSRYSRRRATWKETRHEGTQIEHRYTARPATGNTERPATAAAAGQGRAAAEKMARTLTCVTYHVT